MEKRILTAVNEFISVSLASSGNNTSLEETILFTIGYYNRLILNEAAVLSKSAPKQALYR